MKSELGLQLEQDMNFQRFWWKIERFGWIGILSLLLVACLGGFGGMGIANQTKVGNTTDGLWVAYDRFEHREAPMELTLHFNRNAINNTQLSIWLDQSYLEKIKIEQISPTPQEVHLADDKLIYIFSVDELNTNSTITFHLSTSSFGIFRGQLGLVDGVSYEFHQLIYP